MSPTVDIRPATAPHADAIRIIARAAYSPYIPAIGPDIPPMVADFDALIAARHMHVAICDGIVAGYIAFYPRSDAMHLENVATILRGRGVGTRLIAFCEDNARRLGLRRVDLYTNAAMTRNLSLYPALGYVEVDRRTEHGLHRVFFEKELS